MKNLLKEEVVKIKKLMGILKESSEEEAWEFVGQDHPVIKNLVSKNGLENNEESVEKLIPIIDNLPTYEVTYDQIKNFDNLENKPSDKGLLDKMYDISKTDNSRDEYKNFMEERDKGEGRNRGYNPVDNYDRIVSGEYESPVILKVKDNFYVIGGRTRLYASVASNTPIKVKILSPSDLDNI